MHLLLDHRTQRINPEELRRKIGDRVFGCDVCQQVCPWNIRFAPEEGDPAFAPRPDCLWLILIKKFSLTPEAFNNKFQGSPVKRARRWGYLRNVTVALGNAGDPAAVPALTKALLEDPEPLVRQHAAWALGQISEGKRQQRYCSGQMRRKMTRGLWKRSIRRKINHKIDTGPGQTCLASPMQSPLTFSPNPGSIVLPTPA